MGISRGAIELLAMTLDGTPYHRVATYGVQNVLASPIDIERTLSKYGYIWSEKSNTHPSINLFTSMNCSSVEPIDIYPDEGPTHIIDLNHPVNKNQIERYDLIYDGGTLEHCFDIAQVLRNTAKMIKMNGRIIHHTPTNNWVEHGFYQVSPTLFFDFYEAAGFSNFQFKFHFLDKNKESYLSYSLDDEPPPYFIGNRRRVLSHFTAVKTQETDHDKITTLVQRRYREYFDSDSPANKHSKRTLAQRLKRSILKRTILLRTTRL